MDLGLAGAAVCVQGGTKGMGRATAELFAADGARVAVLARTQRDLDATAEALAAAGSPDAVGYSVDLRDRATVDAAFAAIGERWGELNTLVSCAGPSSGIGPFESLDDDGWHSAFDEGAVSMVRCVRAALPLLRKAAWARIVSVSAHSTKRQSESIVAYTAGKSAMTSITKNLSLSLAPEGILVNTVSPGTFLTDGLRSVLESLPPERGFDPSSPVDCMKFIAEDYGHPCHLMRAGLAHEIGHAIVFCGSRVNSYMTGANVNVDGGSDFC